MYAVSVALNQSTALKNSSLDELINPFHPAGVVLVESVGSMFVVIHPFSSLCAFAMQ